jgi:tetratricopeptide (TPR) repeat protein
MAAQSGLTIWRNRDWKDGRTLALHDVAVSSNSARANTYAAVNMIHRSDDEGDIAKRQQELRQAIAYLEKSAAISADYIDTYIDLGVAWSKLDDVESAAAAWKKAAALSPKDGRVLTDFKWVGEKYVARGLDAGKKGDAPGAIGWFEKATQFDENNEEAWYNLGGALFTLQRYPEARSSWERAIKLNPSDSRVQQGLKALDAAQGRP